MNILTIDTVLDKTYIALSNSTGEVFKTIESDDKNYHSAYLIKVLNELDALFELEYLGVNVGVGSFTGIRVGLSVAKIIAERLGIKAAPYNTFELLSFGYKNKNVMLDARRGSVFYSKDNVSIELVPYDKALEIIEKTGEEFICDFSLKNRFNIENLRPYEGGLDLAKPALEIVKEKIKNGKIVAYSELKPCYVQTPPIFMKK